MPRFLAVLLFSVLFLGAPQLARADDAPSLTDLTVGGGVGSSVGILALAATSVTGATLAYYQEQQDQDFPVLVGGFAGFALGVVALPFWTAGGVSIVSSRAGHPAHYGTALGGAALGLLTYPVFALPFLIPNSDLGPISMIVGAFATVLITMPLCSALMVRRAIRHDDEPSKSSSPLTFGITGRF